jgi:hypothetical protein
VATAAAIGSLIGGNALASNTLSLQTKIVHKASSYGSSGGLATATCPRGYKAVGGGGDGQSKSGGNPFLYDTIPTGTRTWESAVGNSAGGGTVNVTTYAVCARQ